MAALPRFCTVFVSNCSSTSLLIPESYYEHLSHPLPKNAILNGTGGKFWRVGMLSRHGQVYFHQGWDKFVEDNNLADGEYLVFVYDGDRTFEVSIYNRQCCKETRAVVEVEDVSDVAESESSDPASLDITGILGEEIGNETANGSESNSSSLDIEAALGEESSDASGDDSDYSSLDISAILGDISD